MENCQKRLWNKTVKMPVFNELHGDAQTDVLIIGGGAAGLLCGYFLKKRNIDYMILEGDRILSGTTGLTTAKITVQHGLIFNKILSSLGREAARLYMEANCEALEFYRELSKAFPCDFEEKDSFVYLTGGRDRLEAETAAVRKIGFPAVMTSKTELPFKVAGAVKFPNQAQFNPAKFFSQIANGLNIYEKTFVRELMPGFAVTDKGTVKAHKIIVTTHFPILNKHGAYFLKMFQSRSYVIALKNAQNIEGMYVDGNNNGLSFRNYKDLLLLGGGGHRTGKKGGNWEELRKFAEKYYPDAVEEFFWSAQDCMTLDGIPYIGRYSKGSRDIYTATGFNKWGMTSSMAAALILADIVAGVDNKYQKLFSPSRMMLKPQLFINAGEAVINLIGFSRKRCPHMGCRLKWNSVEHSWDCACHGSRFSESGKLLDNPSNGDLY